MNPFRLTKPLPHPDIPIPPGLTGPPYIPDIAEVPRAEEIPSQAPAAEPLMPPDDTPPNLHREILIAPNFISPEICKEYVDYAKSRPEIDLSVFDAEETNRSGEVSWEVDKRTRDTQTVDLEPIKPVVFDLMRYAVRDFLNPFFNVAIKDSEMPQFLVYHPGGHYRPHIDGEALFNDGSGTLSWRRNVPRDISLVLYLNDGFEGGDIVFPKQAISIKPREGMLLAFPSTHHFLHGVNPVTKGTRYALVNWFSLGRPAD